MKTAKSIALIAILTGSFTAFATASVASDAGLPSSTNWQAWNDYMTQPSQPRNAEGSAGVPASTDWQSWNRYMNEPGQNRNVMIQDSLPASTNWKQWNEHIATSGQ